MSCTKLGLQIGDISAPFYPNTVSTQHLLLASLGLPFFIIAIVEAIVFASSRGVNRLRKYFHSATSIYLEYLAAYTVAVFAMEVITLFF